MSAARLLLPRHLRRLVASLQAERAQDGPEPHEPARRTPAALLLFTHRCRPGPLIAPGLANLFRPVEGVSVGAGLALIANSSDTPEHQQQIGSADLASQPRLSTGRWQQNRNIRSCGAVSTCGFCAAYQSSEPVMKALHLAATAVTFAAIFSALMLCGAALTATLYKAIASAPVSAILS